MFTGIIAAVGQIQSMQPVGGDIRVTVNVGKLDMTDVQLGDSIATNGVCITVVSYDRHQFVADLSAETIKRTGFVDYKTGSKVNLEKALQVTDRLGGHIVSGHVDGVGTVTQIEKTARAYEVWIQAPDELAKYFAEKGSVTVDGVSLTVNAVNGAQFMLTIIPHTWQETTFAQYQVGTKVNLEVDVIARYLERLLLGADAAKTDKKNDISMAFLAENGYLR